MKNSDKKFLSLNLTSNIFSPLRQRIFTSLLLYSNIVLIIGNIVNILIGFPLYLIIATFIMNIIFLVLYIKVKKSRGKEIDLYYYIFWGTIFITFPYFWINNAGVDSNLLLLFLMIYIGFFLTSKKRKSYQYSNLFTDLYTLFNSYRFFETRINSQI